MSTKEQRAKEYNLPKGVRRIKPYGLYYDRLRTQEALRYAPEILSCLACGHPYVDGYCCNVCGFGG